MAEVQTRRRPGRRPSGGSSTPGQVQSLSRAVSILNALARTDDGMTLTDVANTVGLAPSTAHRLLTSLQQERFVRFDQGAGLWFVGVQAFIVGSAFVRTRELVSMARPYMRRLMEESGETVNLAVEDTGEAIYLAQIECREMMRAFATPGARVPLHCSGVGKALLAAYDESRLQRILGDRELIKATRQTITTMDGLKRAFDEIRGRGWAFDDEEHAVGLRCVAAVVHNEFREPVCAVSLSGPKARITDQRVPQLGVLVSQAAQDITREIGGKQP